MPAGRENGFDSEGIGAPSRIVTLEYDPKSKKTEVTFSNGHRKDRSLSLPPGSELDFKFDPPKNGNPCEFKVSLKQSPRRDIVSLLLWLKLKIILKTSI